jgi:hypothetical protein
MIRSLLYGFAIAVAATWTLWAWSKWELAGPSLALTATWALVVVPMLLVALIVRPWGQ